MEITDEIRKVAKEMKSKMKVDFDIYALFQGEELKMIGTLSALSRKTRLTESTLDNYRSKKHIETATGENATRLLLVEVTE